MGAGRSRAAACAIEQIVLCGRATTTSTTSARASAFRCGSRSKLSDDAEFKTGVTLVGDHTAQRTSPNPGIDAADGRSADGNDGALRPRHRDEARAAAERLHLRAGRVAGRSTRAERTRRGGSRHRARFASKPPPRWRKTNLTDGYLRRSRSSRPDELAQLAAAARRAARAASLDDATNAKRTPLRARKLDSDRSRTRQAAPRRTWSMPARFTPAAGTFVGTGANGGKPRPIFLLARGDVTQARQAKSRPARSARSLELRRRALTCRRMHREGERRAALATWITDPREPADLAQHRQPRLAVSLRPRARRHAERLRPHGRSCPSHPELLDWLAAEFRDDGGSLKKLHRLIVTSATYRQSVGTANADAEAIDAGQRAPLAAEPPQARSRSGARLRPRGRRQARPHDGRPELPGLRHRAAGALAALRVSPARSGRSRRLHRRSIYRFIVRSQPQPFMTALDCADPSMRVDKRNETLTPLQALALLNNGFMLAMAKHFAERVRANAARRPRHRSTAPSASPLGRAPDAGRARARSPAYAQRTRPGRTPAA